MNKYFKKRSSKTTEQRLVKLLDETCGKIVKNMADWKCQRCGRGKDGGFIMNWAHIIRRANKTMRWRLDNAFCLCISCHYWFDNSTNRGDAEDFIRKKLGNEEWEQLKKDARPTRQWTVKDLEKKYEELKTLL